MTSVRARLAWAGLVPPAAVGLVPPAASGLDRAAVPPAAVDPASPAAVGPVPRAASGLDRAAAERAALLEDLRRRLAILERRPGWGASVPPAPPVLADPGPGRPLVRLEDLPGASATPWGVLVETRLSRGARVGAVAPGDALDADVTVVSPLTGRPVTGGSEVLRGLRIVDIETTGLSGGAGTLPFCVGVAEFERDGALVIRQLVLRSPTGEPALLEQLLGLLDGCTLLVTFNGRTFDVPLLRTRLVLARLRPAPLLAPPHLDLLPVARRLWRARAGECRLVTLEERVLGRARPDDLPGALVPAVYAGFLRTGDAREVARVVAHNRDDLAGTGALLAAALRTLGDPLVWAEDGGELYAVALHRARGGDEAGAVPVVERAVEVARAPALRRRALALLARLHRRAGRIGAACAAWGRYRSEFPGDPAGYVELAKLLEHRARDPAAALRALAGAPDPGDLQHRRHRLQRRLARAAHSTALAASRAPAEALAASRPPDGVAPAPPAGVGRSLVNARNPGNS